MQEVLVLHLHGDRLYRELLGVALFFVCSPILEACWQTGLFFNAGYSGRHFLNHLIARNANSNMRLLFQRIKEHFIYQCTQNIALWPFSLSDCSFTFLSPTSRYIKLTVFLSVFATILRSEVKFLKLLVQPPPRHLCTS